MNTNYACEIVLPDRTTCGNPANDTVVCILCQQRFKTALRRAEIDDLIAEHIDPVVTYPRLIRFARMIEKRVRDAKR